MPLTGDDKQEETVSSLTLTTREISQLEAILPAVPPVDEAGKDSESVAISAARRLPERLAQFITKFALDEECYPVAVIEGLPVDDLAIGPTPPHWSTRANQATALREESFLILVSTLLGHIFAWSTLQNGRLIQNVLPIMGDQQEQSGHGTVDLAWHTEDAFHPQRCHFLLLLALRNRDGVATQVGSADVSRLPDKERNVLQQPRFLIFPDNEHTRHNAIPKNAVAESPWWLEPTPSPVLFGHPSNPYLRIDPYFMTTVPDDKEAALALGMIIDLIEESMHDVVLRPGAIAVIDNYRAVHGRRAFEARYDGTDRWLKKALVSRDLRPSRAWRNTYWSRVIHAVPVGVKSSLLEE